MHIKIEITNKSNNQISKVMVLENNKKTKALSAEDKKLIIEDVEWQLNKKGEAWIWYNATRYHDDDIHLWYYDFRGVMCDSFYTDIVCEFLHEQGYDFVKTVTWRGEDILLIKEEC